MSNNPRRPALIPTRTAIVFLLALATSSLFTAVVLLASGRDGAAMLTGAATLAAAVTFFDRHLERD